jgi:hypothetical protein
MSSSIDKLKGRYIFGPVIGSLCKTLNNSTRRRVTLRYYSRQRHATMDREMERLMQQAQAAGMVMRTDQATPDKCVDYV